MTRVAHIQSYQGWVLDETEYTEHWGADTPWYEAHHEDGRTQILSVGRTGFRWTQERFNWFIDNDFPQRLVRSPLGVNSLIGGPWHEASVDACIAGEPILKRYENNQE